MHVLEAGFETPGRPAVLMIHGFPELAYSWRKVMLPLAAAGYHVFAPDLRGYGRTSGTDVHVRRRPRAVPDAERSRATWSALVSALGYRSVAAIVGHDFGSPRRRPGARVVRPDIFRSVVMMSAPFGGPPALPFNTADAAAAAPHRRRDHIYDELAKLKPPRKHYQRYYSTREANENMWHAAAGRPRLPARLLPHEERRLETEQAGTARGADRRGVGEAAALLRHGPRQRHGRDRWRAEMPSAAEIAANSGCPTPSCVSTARNTDEPASRAGCRAIAAAGGRYASELQLFAGRTIDVPSMFIGGKSDWGVYQNPGALERMQKTACTQMLGVHLSTAPDTGCSRNSRKRRPSCCWTSWHGTR